MLHLDESLKNDKKYNKLSVKVEALRAQKKLILKRSSKWVAAIFLEALVVQLLAKAGIPVFSSPIAMAGVIVIGSCLCYMALKESKGYKTAKNALADAEYELGKYCARQKAGKALPATK